MSRFTPDPDILRLGEALATLRRDRGLSQAEAGARLDMTSQGWGLYEGGRRPGLYRPDVQRRLTSALDATPEDLALAVERLVASVRTNRDEPPQAAPSTPAGVSSGHARVWRDAPARSGAGVQTLILSSDELSPWADAGTVLEFRPGQWPRRGQGCVVETRDGTTRVRLYEFADAQSVRFRGAGDLTSCETLSRDEILGISAITARIDQ